MTSTTKKTFRYILLIKTSKIIVIANQSVVKAIQALEIQGKQNNTGNNNVKKEYRLS